MSATVGVPLDGGEIGGEIGGLIWREDWSDTSLGQPENWPQELRIVLRLILNARQPACVFWGADSICLYNEAFDGLLGVERQPGSVGRLARATWARRWPVIGPQIDQVMGGAASAFHENQVVKIRRDGRLQERFWTYSLSPIQEGHTERVMGVLALCTDTTERVLGVRSLVKENEHQYAFFDRLPDFVGVLRGPDHVYEYVNASYEAFVGQRDLIGHPVRDRFPDVAGQGFFEMLDSVYETGTPVVLQSVPIRFTGENPKQFMDLRYDPIYDASGEIDGIFVSGHDLTERVLAENRRQILAELSERLRDLMAPADIAFAAAEILGQAMHVGRAGYGTIDHSAQTINVDRDWCAPGLDPLSSTGHFHTYRLFSDALRTGEVVAIEDAERDARTVAVSDALKATQTRAFANVPVIEHGELVAVLYVNHSDVRSWSAEDLAFIREFAERTRTAVERSRSDLALRALTASLEQQVEDRTRERDRLWETSEDLLAIIGYEGELFRISPSWTRGLGYDERTLLSVSLLSLLHPDDIAGFRARTAGMRANGQSVRFESRLMVKDGAWRWIAWSMVPEIDGRRITAVGRDVTADRDAATARAILEDQLRQSQKMEAVGQLTGGIAHDFNNMILGVTGSLQIAERRLKQGRADEIAPLMARAKDSAARAAALTHRLLAFSRRQPLAPRPVDANALIGSLEDLFRRTIGERIALRLARADGVCTTLCDPNQLESSLLNLVLNARDAMPDGGLLTIETRNAVFDPVDVRDGRDVEPGSYVCICVKDTGGGMSSETIAKAFEPFFTTKPLGRGTGLGLSMTYGFVRQSNGFAQIDSVLGAGTAITLYLPGYDGTISSGSGRSRVDAPRALRVGRGETILIIEDDRGVRSLVADELTEFGYRVLQAPDGRTGLALLRADIVIDLLVTDIGLPDIDGRQIADAARKERPHLKILFMTGYAETATTPGNLGAEMELITKPFHVEDLTLRVGTLIRA